MSDLNTKDMWKVFHRDELENRYLEAIGKKRDEMEPICYCATKDLACTVAYDYIREGFIVPPGQTTSEAWEKRHNFDDEE